MFCDCCSFQCRDSCPLLHQIKSAHPNWDYLGSGRNRQAWLLPSGRVIKFPKNEYGVDDNKLEAHLFINRKRQRERPHWKLARCKLIPGTDILVMEYIEPIEEDDQYADKPMWVFDVDCEQVGFNKRGEIVAYDFAE